MGRGEQPVRVTHLIYGFEMGGLQQLVLELCTSGRDHGIEPQVIVLEQDGPLRNEAEQRGIAVHRLQGLPGLSVGALQAVRGQLERSGAQVVHAHDLGPWLNAVGVRALRPATAVLATFHQMAMPAGLKGHAARVAARFTGALVACGDQVRGQLERWVSDPRRLRTIGNGIRLPAPATAAERARARARLGLPEGALGIGYLGSLKRIKGPDLLLRAFLERLADREAVHLVLIGAGELEGELRALAAGHPRVHFAGDVVNGAALLPGLDVYAQASRSEGRSLSMLEAMAAGLPTVAHDLPGVAEIHAHGRTALLAPLEDLAALGGALKRLVDAPALRADLGRAARERSRAYSFDATLRAYADLYRELAGAGAAS